MVDITQEELDRLRALEGTKIREGAPLGAPEGEGLAARSIADYLRGGGRSQRVEPRGGYAPLGGGTLSYGQGQGSQTTDYHQMAAERAAARDRGASLAQLKEADAINRQTNEQNPFGWNKRQVAALDNAWQSSPDKVALEARNAERARQGMSPISSTYGQNYYHTNEDGSRDYNYSAKGNYRGAVPEEFRNAPGNANTHDAHFNDETGQWEKGDLSLMQTFKDLGQGAMDAYGNIRNTIPQMGAEVVSGIKDAYSRIKGEAPAPLSDAQIRANSLASANTALNAANQVRRDRDSAGTAAQKAANRAQLQKKATAHTASKVKAFKSNPSSAKAGVSGFNMGGPISAYNVGGIAQSNIREEEIQQQQRAANAPQIASSGPGMGQQLAKKAIGGLLSGATGGLGGMLGGLFNDGGLIGHRMAGGEFMGGVQHRNTGGPLSNPNGYNEGGAMGETPIKKVMDEQKLAQQAKAFELEQQRKKEAHDMAMKQKQQAFSQGQKMKQESATTTMKPKSPLGG